MTKAEFIDEVARKTGQSKKDAGDAVEAMLSTITDTLLWVNPDFYSEYLRPPASATVWATQADVDHWVTER